MKTRFKWMKMKVRGSSMLASAACKMFSWPLLDGRKKDLQKRLSIPQDVPKGHMAVYVGSELKRFIVRVTYLEHPSFQALLDQAREEYGFRSYSGRLCIPCDVTVFLAILGYVTSLQQDQRIWLCF